MAVLDYSVLVAELGGACERIQLFYLAWSLSMIFVPMLRQGLPLLRPPPRQVKNVRLQPNPHY